MASMEVDNADLFGGLSNEDLVGFVTAGESILARVNQLFGIPLKTEQVSAIRHLLYQKLDLILIAKTGFGKSIIFQAAPLLTDPVGIALILMPLKALQNEQCKKLSNILTARPFVLNGDTNTDINLRAIASARYTHVFTSPEIAVSKKFNFIVLQSAEFQYRIKLLAIDELHLVFDWRNFRPQYAGLRILRNRLPRQLPFLGVSATLDPSTLERVKESIGYYSNVRVVKTSIDRPEIYIQTSSLRAAMKGMDDLQSLLPADVDSYLDIPKTIIYIDSISDVLKATDRIRGWMRRLGYPSGSHHWVSPFFSDMADLDKELVEAAFKLPHIGCFWPRILIATEAYGLGIDNPDVKFVVQWLLPPSIKSLYQRLGRAMRCAAEQARFIFFYPDWCIGPRAPAPIRDAGTADTACVVPAQDAAEVNDNNETEPVESSSRRKTKAERRRDMADGLWDILNTNGCIRLQGLRYFDDCTYSDGRSNQPDPCCSSCNPDFRFETKPHWKETADTGNALRRPWFRNTLKSWRDGAAESLCFDCQYGFSSVAIMTDEYLDLIAKYGEQIVDGASMTQWAGPWVDMELYLEEVLAILKVGRELPEEGEIFEAWSAHNDLVRGASRKVTSHVYRNPVALAEEEREERRNAWLLLAGIKPTDKRSKAKGSDSQTQNSPSQRSQTATPPIQEREDHIDDSQLQIQLKDASQTRDSSPVLSEGDSAAPSVQSPIPRPRKARAQVRRPLEEVCINTLPEISSSQFGRKRRRPAYMQNPSEGFLS